MELEGYLKLPYPITLRLDSDGDWIAEVEDLEGCVAHGESQTEALDRLEEAKRLWIEETLAHGQPVPQPTATEVLPSGRWVQRVPRSLHKNLARLAKVEGTSLNQLVTSILSAHLGAAQKSQEAATVWVADSSSLVNPGDAAMFATHDTVSRTRQLLHVLWGSTRAGNVEDAEFEELPRRGVQRSHG